MTEPAEVLDFWFAGDPSQRRAAWFQKDAAFDAACARFASAAEAARGGAFDHWSDTAEGALALLILLDQFPRNLYRGSALAFAADADARAVASAAIARGFDRALTPVQRMFVYLPFEHSENLADQDLAVGYSELLEENGGESARWAHIHRNIIVRFGRFPHRNACLGRETTPEEQAYLDEGGFRG